MHIAGNIACQSAIPVAGLIGWEAAMQLNSVKILSMVNAIDKVEKGE